MWRRTVLTFSLAIIHTLAQPDSNETETAVRECCPCPPRRTGLTQTPGPVAPGVLAVAKCAGLPGLKHCPCLPRDADSEGSASSFFPENESQFGNFERPKIKEDAKPLLHPEVDLASSMLETLREATEEEYRDAIERDVARAATSDMDTDILSDVFPVENRNVVTIIVSPEDMSSADDSMPQASHVHDTRCIRGPLGNARLSNYHQPQVSQNGLDDILNLPLPGGLIHKQRDNNLAASNVHESVVKVDNSLNKYLSGFKLRTGPSLLNLAPVKTAKNSNNNNDCNNGQNSDNMSFDRRLSGKSNDADPTAEESFSNIFDVLEVIDLDNDPFPSNTQGNFFEATEREENNSESSAVEPKFETQNYFQNLQKLRDVEFIPLDVRKIIPTSKLSIPDFSLGTFLNKARESDQDPIKLPKLFDWLGKPSKMSHKNDEANSGHSTKGEDYEESALVQIIPRNKNVKTEILDAVPSPSESVNFVSSKDNCLMQPQEADKVMKEGKELFNSTSAESFESDPEIESNSKPKNENDIDIVDLDNGDDAIHSINVNPEISSEYIDMINDNIDNLGLDQEGKNSIISSQKEISDFPSSTVDLRELNGKKEKSNKVLAEGHPQKILDNIRSRVIEKLDAVLLENARDFISENVKEKSLEGTDTDDEGISLVGQVINSKEDPATESTSYTSLITDELPSVSASIEEVSYKDLQNMSNSLLQESEKNIALKENQTQTIHNLKSVEKLKEGNSDSRELREVKIGKVINEAGNIGKKNVIEEKSIASILKKTSNIKTHEMIVPNTINKVNCDHDLEPLASERVISSKLRPNSKSLMDHLSDFESRLRQNIIVQPKPAAALAIPDISEFSTNIPTLEEIRSEVSEILGGLARHTFGEEVSYELDSDDLASNVKPVLSNGRLTSDSTLSPKQLLKDIDLNIIQLKPLLSTPQVDPLRIEVPGLNLNTYKAKLAIPNSMDIRPLNLASTMSNGGGLVGATLSIRPEKYSNVGNIKSTLSTPDPILLSKVSNVISNVKNNARHSLIIPKATKGPHLTASNNLKDITDNLKHYTESTVKNIHQNLNYPSFGDIHTNIKANSDNLLSASRNAIETLQNRAPIDNVVDNLKSQTENTMKHLQQTLDSPMISDLSSNVLRNKINLKPSLTTGNKLLSNNFNVPTMSNFADDLRSHTDSAFRNMLKTSSTPILPEISIPKDKEIQKTLKAKLRQNAIKDLPPITDPKEVLQIISNHREDFHDKLFALHTDLSDRLESMHNDVINPERLKTILSPSNNRYFESFYIPLPSRPMSVPNAKKPARPVLKTKQPSLGAQRKEFRKSSVSQTLKPKSSTSKFSTMRAGTGKERNSPKLSKLESAGTAPTVARINRPALPKIYSKPRLSKPLDGQLLKIPLYPQPGTQGAKKLLLPKDNHLTGFGQTTIRPSAAPSATTKKINPSGRPKVSNNNRFKPKPFVRQPTPWSAWDGPKTTKSGDSRTSPSTAHPKLQAPLKSKTVIPLNKTTNTAPLLPNLGSLSSRIQPQSLLKTQPNLKIQPTPQARVSYPEKKLLSGPKKINSSLLSKLTEALKSRQAKANLSSSPGESSPRVAMAPAASERLDTVVAPDEAIKENVSYKCKMMCVRTDNGE